MCDIPTCTACNLVISLVERGTDGKHVSLVLDKIVIHSHHEIISTVCDFPFKIIEKCFQ